MTADTPPVACTITDEERAARPAWVQPVLAATFSHTEETDDGIALVFDGVDRPLDALSTFVSNERECCAFATYRIVTEPPYEETRLEIDGPEGTAETITLPFAELLAGERPDSDATSQHQAVREYYAAVARGERASCGADSANETVKGYNSSDLEGAPPGTNLGLGCGNPTGIASLEEGQTVLDLGSGAGFDCNLAAEVVGPTGQVIGVDMTPEMVERARTRNDDEVIEFRLGEIEHLPVADRSVDVVLSNCVINLSPDTAQVFEEAYRVLVPSGRLAIADVVQTAPIPDDLRSDPEAVASCAGDALTVDTLEEILAEAGFVDIQVEPTEDSEEFIREWSDDRDPSAFLVSATIEAQKPIR